MVIAWAIQQRAGTLAVGDPRGVLALAAGRRHNRRVRDWRIGHLIAVLADKAEVAGITVTLVDERGTSSTCPKCLKRVPKPAGRIFTCPHCGFTGHRDLVAAAHIAARTAAGSRQSLFRLTSCTVGPDHTFPVCPRPGVTRAAALITAAPAGPLAGTGPPRPPPPGAGEESLAPRRGPRKHPANLRRGALIGSRQKCAACRFERGLSGWPPRPQSGRRPAPERLRALAGSGRP